MPNLYGVANPITQGGNAFTPSISDVACTAGATTTFCTFQLSAPIIGVYFPILWISIDIAFGGTAPSAVLLAWQINGGSNVSGIGLAAAALVAGATYRETVTLVGTPAYHFWDMPPPPTITVSINPTGQAVTVKGSSSTVAAQLLRGPD